MARHVRQQTTAVGLGNLGAILAKEWLRAKAKPVVSELSEVNEDLSTIEPPLSGEQDNDCND